jgi:hypothetical protein
MSKLLFQQGRQAYRVRNFALAEQLLETCILQFQLWDAFYLLSQTYQHQRKLHNARQCLEWAAYHGHILACQKCLETSQTEEERLYWLCCLPKTATNYRTQWRLFKMKFFESDYNIPTEWIVWIPRAFLSTNSKDQSLVQIFQLFFSKFEQRVGKDLTVFIFQFLGAPSSSPPPTRKKIKTLDRQEHQWCLALFSSPLLDFFPCRILNLIYSYF